MTFTGVTNAAVRLTRTYAIKSDFACYLGGKTWW